MSSEVLCYNRGCGKSFKLEENEDDGCSFHSGLPFFHETYKGWTCCNKKSTDFTEFLHIKGCQRSRHSNVKPPEPDKPKQNIIEEPNKIEEVRKPLYVPKERPSTELEMVPLQRTINNGLAKALESLSIELCPEKKIEADGPVKKGSSCHNKGCRATYAGQESDQDTCVYHEGVPIFHEGLKYWTCCQRKTTDFDAFLCQIGCIEGQHCWRKPIVQKEDIDKSKACRFDWHQTGSHVVLTIFSKTPIPDLSVVEANAVKLNISILFGSDKQEFANSFELFGVIDIDKSNVTFYSTKVEISMKKAEPVNWPNLVLLPVTAGVC